jgi:hypothetical protein
MLFAGGATSVIFIHICTAVSSVEVIPEDLSRPRKAFPPHHPASITTKTFTPIIGKGITEPRDTQDAKSLQKQQ